MGKKLSELPSLSEITGGDFFMATDDTTGASRRASFSVMKSSVYDNSDDSREIKLAANTAGAIKFTEDSTDYIVINTNTTDEDIVFKKQVHFDDYVRGGFRVVTDSPASTADSAIRIDQYSDNNGSTQLRLYKSRGTEANPTAISSGDALSKVLSYAYDGSSFVSSGNAGWTATSNTGDAYFNVRNRESGSLVTKMTLDSDGLKIGTDTAAANAIDEYEEGTWTPAYVGTTGNPTCTYDQQGGTYVKIGKTVHVYGRLRTDSVSGGGGNLRLGGLPFTATSSTDARGGIFCTVSSNFASGSPRPVGALVVANASYANLYANGNSTDTNKQQIGVGDLGNTANDNQIHFFGSYVVD